MVFQPNYRFKKAQRARTKQARQDGDTTPEQELPPQGVHAQAHLGRDRPADGGNDRPDACDGASAQPGLAQPGLA